MIRSVLQREPAGTYDSGMRDGIKTGWDAMVIISDMTEEQRRSIYGEDCSSTADVFQKYINQPQDAVRMLKDWIRERREDLHIGDEIKKKTASGDTVYGVVTRVTSDPLDAVVIMTSEGRWLNLLITDKTLEKTGRHYAEFENVLASLTENAEKDARDSEYSL